MLQKNMYLPMYLIFSIQYIAVEIVHSIKHCVSWYAMRDRKSISHIVCKFNSALFKVFSISFAYRSVFHYNLLVVIWYRSKQSIFIEFWRSMKPAWYYINRRSYLVIDYVKHFVLAAVLAMHWLDKNMQAHLTKECSTYIILRRFTFICACTFTP